MADIRLDETTLILTVPADDTELMVSDVSESQDGRKVKKITLANLIKILDGPQKMQIQTSHPAVPNGSDYNLIYAYSPGADQDTQVYVALRQADGTYTNSEVRVA